MSKHLRIYSLALALCLVAVFPATSFADLTSDLAAEFEGVLVEPWNGDRVQKLLKKVGENEKQLLRAPQGQNLILKAKRLSLAYEMSRKLEDCAQGNKAAARVQAAVVRGILTADPCGISPKGKIASLQAWTDEVKAKSAIPVDQREKEAFTQSLLNDFIVRSAAVSAQLSYLLDTGEHEDKIPDEISNSFCADSACTPERRKNIAETSRQVFKEMKAKGHRRETPSEAATRISSYAKNLFSIFYSASASSGSSRYDSRAETTLSIEQKAAIFKTKNPASAFKSWEASKLLELTPQSFYIEQEKLKQDPLTSILARSNGKFARKSGAEARPALNLKTPGHFQLALSHMEGESSSPSVYDEGEIPIAKNAVTPSELAELKNSAKKALAAEVIALQKQDIRSSETLIRLVVVNPAQAGRLLLENPSLGSVICDQLESLAKSDRRKQWLTGTVAVGELILGFFPMVGIARLAVAPTARAVSVSARVSGAAATAIGLGAVSAGYESYESFEMAKHYYAACLADVSTQSNCRNFKESIDKAHGALALGTLGTAMGVGFVRSAAKAARSSEQMSVLSNTVREYLPAWKANQGDEIDKLLGSDVAGEFHVQLASAPPEVRKRFFNLMGKLKNRPEELKAFAQDVAKKAERPACSK